MLSRVCILLIFQKESVYCIDIQMNYARYDIDQLLTEFAPGPMQSKLPRARRVLVSGGEAARVGASPSVAKDSERNVTQPQRGLLGSSRLPNAMPGQQKVDSTSKLGSSAPEELMLTSSSMLKSTTDTRAHSVGQQKDEANLLIDTEKLGFSSQITSCNALMGESFKKGQLDSVANPLLTSQSKKPFLSLILYCKVVYMFSYQFTLQVII